MFIFNVKLGLSKKLAAVMAAISIVIAVICIISMTVVHNAVPDTATCDELGEYSLSAETRAEQMKFLERLGFDVSAENVQKKSITIPSEFNQTYEDYNVLQKKIGLDLSRFKGKKAEMITYPLNGDGANFAVLLVYEGRVIGGHITNGEYGYENQPLI